MKIKFFSTFRDIVNLKEIEMKYQASESYTVNRILQELIKRFPKLQTEIINTDGTILKMTHILVNGRNIIHLEGLETQLKPTDEIALIPPVGGG